MYCYSAILLMDKNLNLSQNLKRVCETHGVNLLYEKSFSSLIYAQLNIKPNFIFIDVALANENYNYNELTNNPFATKIIFVSATIKQSNLIFDCLTVEEMDEYLMTYEENFINYNTQVANYGKQVNNLLFSLGISPNHLGKDYLFECINLVIADKKRFGCLNKSCYPVLSLKYQTNSSSIERDIRHAIVTAWSKKNTEKWQTLLYGFDVSAKPSNRQFICLCAEIIKMEHIK